MGLQAAGVQEGWARLTLHGTRDDKTLTTEGELVWEAVPGCDRVEVAVWEGVATELAVTEEVTVVEGVSVSLGVKDRDCVWLRVLLAD